MKLFKQARKYGAKVVAASAGGLTMGVALATTDPLTDALTSIDLTAVGAAVAVIVLAVIAISLGFKGADLGKRAIRKV